MTSSPVHKAADHISSQHSSQVSEDPATDKYGLHTSAGAPFHEEKDITCWAATHIDHAVFLLKTFALFYMKTPAKWKPTAFTTLTLLMWERLFGMTESKPWVTKDMEVYSYLQHGDTPGNI